MEDDTVDPKIWQRVAETELASATHSRNVLLEAHQDTYKWLLASLLAINSGGLLALLNIDTLHGHYKLFVALAFYAGIMASLLSSYLSQRASRQLLPPLGEAMGYWISVANDGQHIPQVWDNINLRIQGAVKEARPTQIAGWVSALCFSVGFFGVILDIQSSLPASQAVPAIHSKVSVSK